MAEQSHIEWTDATWNPITGCSVVSPGCTNCYAMKLAGTRLRHHPSREGLTVDSKAGPVWNGKVRLNEAWLDQPLTWKRPRMIFVCAHGDLFHEDVPDEWIDHVFAIMAIAPQHTFQVLTKRAERMRRYLSKPDASRNIAGRVAGIWYDERNEKTFAPGLRYPRRHAGFEELDQWPLANVWLGVSAEDQRRADERIPHLLATPAKIRFLSAEPLLAPIDLTRLRPQQGVMLDALQAYAGHQLGSGIWEHGPCDTPHLDWVIVGGESGPGARPMHPQWAREIRDRCDDADVPFFFKQWGAFRQLTDAERKQGCGATFINGRDRYDPEAYVLPASKKSTGRLLDGVEHNAMPQAQEVSAL